MTPDAINIAIAEACGWTLDGEWRDRLGGRRWLNAARTRCVYESDPGDGRVIPDYFDDLNEIAEAEKTLANEQEKRLYVAILVSVLKPGEFTVMASAAQRAEAFLRYRKLWIDAVPAVG